MTMQDQTSPASATSARILNEWIAKHGGLQGNAYPLDAEVDQYDAGLGKPVKVPNPNPTYHYTFADGSTLDIDGSGAIRNTDEKQPKSNANEGWTNVTPIRQPDGSTVYYGKGPDGNYGLVPGLPAGAATATTTTKAPTPADKLEVIKDPTSGKPIKLRDPSTGTVIDLPDGASASKPSIVQGAGGAIYSWDGSKLTLQQAGAPVEKKPAEGATRRNVQSGMAVTEVYRGGSWTIDPSVAPVPYDTTKPKEGDVRPNTDNKGQAVQEIYRGGSWVTDTSVAPKPFGTQAPATLSAPAGQEFIVQQPAGGGPTTNIPNPNFRPEDVAGRVKQLQGLASKERDRINALPIDDNAKRQQFDQWWAENIAPETQQLQQTQQQQQTKAQQDAEAAQRAAVVDEATYERNRQADARTAGRDAVANVTATLPYRVGPEFGQHFAEGLKTLSSGGGPVNFGASDFTYTMPNLDQVSEQATAKALAHISPYAALKAGAPMPQVPQGVDLNAALNQSRYSFGGSAPTGGTTTIAPDGTVTIQHTQPDPLTSNAGSPLRGPLFG